ncbi:Chromatin assembly factor 1 subunit p50 [Dionaea muscipula]
MASLSHTAIMHSKSLASDHLQISSRSFNDVPLRSLARTRFCVRRRDAVVAKLRKVKKHEYPWPDDPDPNVKGGVLTHLSHFKPLKEKPKPVTLDFEKPLLDLQKKIADVRRMANETGLDFIDQIALLESKYQQALKELYTHLTPIQRVNIARHPNRPTFLDHVFSITEKFVELHGDRAGYDDPAIVTGIGTINGRRYMFIGNQKGRNTKENIARNFGMPTPHGYRKALRLMKYADHHGFPIITFIDTPGAYADLKSEELGQGEAIAQNLRTMFGLKVPIVSIVIGEGGSGGALAIGCGNKLLMLENAVFYVASPEACAAILWKSAKEAPRAAKRLRITARELCKLNIADGIIPEPLGGAHADPAWTSQQIKNAVVEAMDELVKMGTEELLRHRAQKFRKMGGFKEGVSVGPERKMNMKKKKEEQVAKTSTQELESEIRKLEEQGLKPSISSLDKMIRKLKREVEIELVEAVEALGFKGRLMTILEEIAKTEKSPGQLIGPALLDKISKFKEEWSQSLPTASNYASLTEKANMLRDLSESRNVSVKSMRSAPLKQEFDKKFKELLDRADLKERIEKLKAEVLESGASSFNDLDQEIADRVLKMKKEIESEVTSALKPLNLDVKIVNTPNFISKIEELNGEIQERIEETVRSSSDLKKKIDQLRLEVLRAGKKPNAGLRSKIQDLQQQVRGSLLEALTTPELTKKLDELKAEISQGTASSEGGAVDGGLNNTTSRLLVNVEA